MDWVLVSVLMMGGIMAAIGVGIPVAFGFLALNLVGAWFIMGGMAGVAQSVSNATSSLTVYALTPIPMFMIMGELFFRTGLAPRVFDALELLMGRIPGRLSHLTIGGGTLFAALSGSSIANTAMMGGLMVPNMVERNYKLHMIVGPIMAAGGLAILIPPSGLGVLLGSLARIDIGALLIAGIMPGLILAGMYFVMVIVQTKIDPSSAPAYEVRDTSWAEKFKAVAVNVLPMGLVIFAVIGVIILGIATPTEASAFGVLAVLVLALLYRCLTWSSIVLTLESAMRVTVMLLLIIMGSSTFSQLLAFSGASTGMVEWATGFDVSPTVILIMMFLVLVVLGCFMDQVSMLMLTLPIFMPITLKFGFDPVWFGIILMMSLEISLFTPPFGLLLFVMLGVAPKGTTLGQVSMAGLPYLACQFILVALIVMFPKIALWLPSLM